MSVQPLEAEVIAERFALDLVFLNEAAEELKCEGRPEAHGADPCSVEVTHLAASCGLRDVPVCGVLVAYKRSQIEQGVSCRCGSPAASCWTYRPI